MTQDDNAQQTPAGWYPAHGQWRYWDGAAWTEHVAPMHDPAAESATEPGPAEAAHPDTPDPDGVGRVPDGAGPTGEAADATKVRGLRRRRGRRADPTSSVDREDKQGADLEEPSGPADGPAAGSPGDRIGERSAGMSADWLPVNGPVYSGLEEALAARQSGQKSLPTRREKLARTAKRLATSFHGLRIEGDVLISSYGAVHQLKYLEASVEQGVNRTRTTATRVLGGAVLSGATGALVGGMAKKNQSVVYLVITSTEGEGLQLSIPAKEEGAARSFATKVNAEAERVRREQR